MRTTDDAPNPVFVSVGHRVRCLKARHELTHSLQTAIDVCIACSKFRVPEPVRMADQKSRAFLRGLRDSAGTSVDDD